MQPSIVRIATTLLATCQKGQSRNVPAEQTLVVEVVLVNLCLIMRLLLQCKVLGLAAQLLTQYLHISLLLELINTNW